MLTVLTFLGVLAALFFAAALATREEEQLQPAPPDAADLALPAEPLSAQDVAAVRFGLAPRGYRMSEVDAVLERLSGELAQRDEELARLRRSGASRSPAALVEPAVVEPAVVEPVVVTPVPEPVEVDAAPTAAMPATPPPSAPVAGPAATGVPAAASVRVGGEPTAPDLSAGEAPREPVDPPGREDSTLPR